MSVNGDLDPEVGGKGEIGEYPGREIAGSRVGGVKACHGERRQDPGCREHHLWEQRMDEDKGSESAEDRSVTGIFSVEALVPGIATVQRVPPLFEKMDVIVAVASYDRERRCCK